MYKTLIVGLLHEGIWSPLAYWMTRLFLRRAIHCITSIVYVAVTVLDIILLFNAQPHKKADFGHSEATLFFVPTWPL